MPSDTAMVVKISPTPPLSTTPCLAASHSLAPDRLHGCDLVAGRDQTDLRAGEVLIGQARPPGASPCAPALAGPSVTSWEWILFGMPRWYVRLSGLQVRSAGNGVFGGEW